jgi:hypothetical protein
MQGQVGAVQDQLAALQGTIDNFQATIQRCRNASATQLSHTLVIPKNAANQAVPAGMWVPRTLEDLLGLCDDLDLPRATALLHYYDANAVIPEDVDLCRQAVAICLGVRLA